MCKINKSVILILSFFILFLSLWLNSYPRYELPLIKLFYTPFTLLRYLFTDGSSIDFFRFSRQYPLPLIPSEHSDYLRSNYTVNDHTLQMLILIPKHKPDGLMDTLVEFHSGGFVLGTEDFLYISVGFFPENDTNFVLFSPEYRLAPDYPFPYAPEDSYQALKWVRAHAREYGANPDRIIICGASAGGNLAAVVSIMARDDPSFIPKPIAQIVHIPITDFHLITLSMTLYPDTPFWNSALMLASRYCYVPNIEDWKDPRCSPLYAETHKGLPPAFISVNIYDPFYDEGVAFYEKLKKDLVPVEFYSFEAYHASEIASWLIFGGYKKEIKEYRDLLKKFLTQYAPKN